MTETPHLSGRFDDWVANATPGTAVIYHTGQYAGGATCREAMAACDAGLVELVRVRADQPHTFHYIAQRRRHGRKR
jgi:hypothetical protein